MPPEQREDWDNMLDSPLPQKPGGTVKAAPKATQADIDADMASFFSAQQILGG